MAQNRVSAGILGRKSGGSILARAAYNHRTQYRDQRTGKLTDDNSPYRADMEWEALFAKDIDNVPEWWKESRERIFNELEKRSDRCTRPDAAQLAYDFKISLPHELNADQRQQLITDWALQQTGKGYVVDVALHKPNPKENDPRNYHAHILIPMRPIDRDGWGNTFRAPENTRTGFEKWARQNLREWKEEFSELGARYLERAGFHEEAERFRAGHLSRPERARAAHARGDTQEFERLLDEPQRYMGPAASAMERNNKRTRTGDINREVEERNRLRGPMRGIREAYVLSQDHAFAEVLEQKDMMLARVTKDDARNYATDFAITDTYVPQYREGEYLIVTEQGAVYRLNRAATGDSYKGVQRFTKSLDQHDYPSLDAALNEMHKRSMVPKLDRNAVIAEMMQPKPPTPRFQSLEASLTPTESGLQRGMPFDDPKAKHRTAVPEGAKHLQIRSTDGEHMWWAYNSTDNPEAFHDSLKERVLHLARVTAEDANDSRTQHWAAKRLGVYHPILREGEYVVVNNRGQACRLDDRTVGHNLREVRAFMAPLDSKPIESFRTVQNRVHESRMKEADGSPSGAALTQRFKRGIRTGAQRSTALGRESVDAGGDGFRLGGKLSEFAISFVESFLAPIQTPEQREQGKLAEQGRRMDADEAERHRRNNDRDR